MLLEVDGLSKRYVRGRVAVDALTELSFRVPEGAFVTVTGPSGSGKTTLLLTLAGLLTPSAGRISFRGAGLERLSDGAWAAFRRRHLGFVMQSFSLVPYLTAEENVALPLALSGTAKDEQRERARVLLARVGLSDRATHLPRELSAGQQQRVAIARALANEPALVLADEPTGTAKDEQRERARVLLARVGLSDRAAHLPRELSAGQQQRVAIARALANEPALVLADEPTGNLDPGLAREVLGLLQRLNAEQGLALLMVTHSPEAAALGSMRLHLEAGRLVG